MKIAFKQFLNCNHSWGTVGTGIAKQLIKLGHEVHLCSTNGYEFFPKDLNDSIQCKNCTVDHLRKPEFCNLDKDYDLAISYTLPTNWYQYLDYGEKKIAIYNFDGSILPAGFAKYHKFVNMVLPSSEYSYKTFANANIPKEKMKVFPHGYDEEFINRTEIYPLKTDKKYKVLVNIQQPHFRKNLEGILDAIGMAFTKRDDVAIIIKVNTKKPASPYDINFLDLYKIAKQKYSNFPETIILDTFIDHISDLYRAVDIVFSCSHIECFHLPSLESMAAGKITIASGIGGNTTFMNNTNSLLINGKMGRAPANCQYWSSNVNAEMFFPNIKEAAEVLKDAVDKFDLYKQTFAAGIEKVQKEYSWENQTKNLLEIVKTI